MKAYPKVYLNEEEHQGIRDAPAIDKSTIFLCMIAIQLFSQFFALLLKLESNAQHT